MTPETEKKVYAQTQMCTTPIVFVRFFFFFFGEIAGNMLSRTEKQQALRVAAE